MYLARDLTGHSLEEIGGHFGGRDHTTVLHAYRNIDKQCDHDEKIRAPTANVRMLPRKRDRIHIPRTHVRASHDDGAFGCRDIDHDETRISTSNVGEAAGDRYI